MCWAFSFSTSEENIEDVDEKKDSVTILFYRLWGSNQLDAGGNRVVQQKVCNILTNFWFWQDGMSAKQLLRTITNTLTKFSR